MKDYVDLSIRSVQSHVDAQVDMLGTKIDTLATRVPSKWTIFQAVGGALVAVLAILAFAGDRFDGGFAASSSYSRQVEENRHALSDLASQQGETREALERLIEITMQQDGATANNPPAESPS